jgi:peptidoglycan/LPS O-acetylase OafA/YrhL
LLISRLPRRAIGVLLALVSAAAVIAASLWPQPAGQALMAAEPGLLLLILILAVQRFAEWRHLRRLARMPGFSRVHAESSLARANGKRVAQTSTVDAPAAP